MYCTFDGSCEFHFYSSFSGRVIQYYLLRCMTNYDLLEKFNLIGRTSEFARLYGILFYSVLSRGTQVSLFSLIICYVLYWFCFSIVSC